MKNKLLTAYETRFGKPDALIPLETGSAKIDIAIGYPVEDEDMFESLVTTLGLSEAGEHKIEFFMDVPGKPSENTFKEIGKALILMWESNATENKPLLPGRIFRNVSFPLFNGMDAAILVDHGGFQDDQWIDMEAEGAGKGRLLDVVPLYSMEADALEKVQERLRHLILIESKTGYRNPQRKQTDPVPLALLKTWQGISAWYTEHNIAEAGKLSLQLESGFKKNIAADIEKQLGIPLPEDFRQSFAIMHVHLHVGLFELLDIDGIIRISTALNKMNEQGLFVKGLEKLEKNEKIAMAWWHTHWIPFAMDSHGDFLCIDLCPGPEGTVGQIIYHSRDEGRFSTGFLSFLEWLTNYRSRIEYNQCEISEGYLYFPDWSCY